MKPFPQAMSAKDELRRAQELVGFRRALWVQLLDYPPFAEALAARIVTLLGDGHEGARETVEGLCEAAAGIRARECSQTVEAYAQARDRLADRLHRHPHEAGFTRTLLAAIRRVGGSGGLDARRPPRGSQVHRAYLAGLRRAEADLTSARQAFVAHNLRLVVAIARRYTHPTLTQADLIQEGTLGLLRAVDGYDPGRGTRFSTYAGWWIKHGITRAIANHGLTVRVPANVLGLRSQLRKAEQQVIAEQGHIPTTKELAGRVGVSVKAAANARRAVLGPAELPGEVDGLGLVDEQLFDLDEVLDRPIVERAMLDHVDDLPGIEGAVIRKRFALDGEPPMTLAEIGELHCLSRERIRQIEKQALRRMRGQLRPLLGLCG